MDVNDLEGRKRRRVPMIAQLTMGIDDDLIAWLMSYSNGEKQAAIKEAVRRSIRPTESKIKVKQGKSGRPRRHVEEVAYNPVAQLPDDAAQRIAQLEHENRRLQQLMEEWITFFNNRFDQVILGGAPDGATEPIEAITDLDQETKQVRTVNLTSAKW